MDFDPKKDYYNMLGVSETATEEEIKKAFKKMALQYHPDRGGDQEKFKEINEAYQVIGDSKKRQQYDSFRQGGGGFGGFDFGGQGGFGGGGFDMGGFDIGDLLGGFFGGGGSSGRKVSTEGRDVQVNMTISFEESYHGIQKIFSFRRLVLDKDIKSEKCPKCQGKGAYVEVARTPFGNMQVQSVCSECQGLGVQFTKNGSVVANALKQEEQSIEVNIPQAVKDGVFLKFSSKGHFGVTGENPGDLYIKLTVKDSDKYQRVDDDIIVKPEVSVVDMVLGADIEVSHPDGKTTIKVPKGTQVGDKIKIPGKGFGKGGYFAKKGNLIVIPRVSIPKKLTKSQEKLRQGLRSD